MNVFAGPNAVKEYLDMSRHAPTSIVELPHSVMKFHKDVNVRAFLKLMGPESAIQNFKMVPTWKWFDEQERLGTLKKGIKVVINSSGCAGLAAVVIGKAFGVNVIVIMPEDSPQEKQLLIKRAGGELVLSKEIPGELSGVELARVMGKNRRKYLTYDQYGDELNWKGHFDVTIRQIFEQMEVLHLKIGAIVVAMGTTGTLVAAREYCKQFSPATVVVGVMSAKGEPIPAMRTLERLGPRQISFDWKQGTRRVEVRRYEAYAKTVDLLPYGFKVGLSTGGSLVGMERFANDVLRSAIFKEKLQKNEDGSVVMVGIAGDILDPYLNQLRVILDPKDL